MPHAYLEDRDSIQGLLCFCDSCFFRLYSIAFQLLWPGGERFFWRWNNLHVKFLHPCISFAYANTRVSLIIHQSTKLRMYMSVPYSYLCNLLMFLLHCPPGELPSMSPSEAGYIHVHQRTLPDNSSQYSTSSICLAFVLLLDICLEIWDRSIPRIFL